MKSIALSWVSLVALAACVSVDTPPQASVDAVLFEGARLIVGDASPPIEDSAFLVEDGRFTRVGTSGSIDVPEETARVDLSGQTVMPAIIDMHVHVGYVDVMARTDTPDNYSRANVVDHLNRMAYYGVGAALSMGLDPGDTVFELRAEAPEGATRLLTAGAGIAMPNAGPGAADRRDVPYGVTNVEEVTTAVHELVERNVDLVKIWVDDRNQTVEKLTPELYEAIINEAHGHDLTVAAHVFYLEDAKGLLRAGLDGFAHGVRDLDVDDEFMELLAERPEVFLIPNLPASGLRTVSDLAYMGETLPPDEIESMRQQLADQDGAGSSEGFLIQARNLVRMHEAGVRVAMGTDGDGAGWQVHEEMADMVAAGLTPAEVIQSATGTSAEILGLEDLGTVAPGKSADFLILDANPLDNITNTRRISSVYLRGVEVDRRGVRVAEDIQVLTVGSLRAGLDAIAARYSSETGRNVSIEVGTATQLAARLAEGATPDVLIATESVIEQAADTVDVSTGSLVGRVGIGMVVRTEAALSDVGTMEDLERVLLEADSITYNRGSSGIYVEGLIERMGLGGEVDAKTVRYGNGGEVLDHVLNGEGVDVGFAPVTVIRSSQSRGLRLLSVPEAAQNYTSYTAVAMRGASGDAEDLIRYLLTEASSEDFALTGVD